MRSLNRHQMIGNVGKDPEVRYTQSGTAAATCSLATNESYIDKDGNKHDQVEWHNLVFYGKAAEVVKQYVHKGSRLYAEGKSKTRSWDDKNTGTKRYITEVIVSEFLMLDPREKTA